MKLLILTFALLGFAVNVQAASFDEYVARLSEHPQVIQILEQSQRHKELSDGAMGLPDPVLIVGVDNIPFSDPSFDSVLPSSKIFGFKQQIPSYLLRKANSQKQELLSDKQKLLADYTVKRLEAIMISMLVNLDKVKLQESLAEKQLTYYKALEEFFKGKLESGNAVYWRFSEVDVERSQVERTLNDLIAQRVDIEAELVRLIDEVPNIALPNIPNLNWYDEEELLYPLKIIKEDIAIASKSVDAADAAFEPNYGINTLYKQRESGKGFNGDDWFSAKVTISVPLWYSSNQEPKLRAAKAGKRSAKSAYMNAVGVWKRKLRGLFAKQEAALANVKVFIEKDAALDEMVASAENSYEAGESDLDIVLDAQINQLTIKSQLAEQRAKHLALTAEINSHIIGEK